MSSPAIEAGEIWSRRLRWSTALAGGADESERADNFSSLTAVAGFRSTSRRRRSTLPISRLLARLTSDLDVRTGEIANTLHGHLDAPRGLTLNLVIRSLIRPWNC